MSIKVIGFDADDTLWINKTLLQNIEYQFINLFDDSATRDIASKVLYKIENKNHLIYGYGIKGFTLSMIEALIELSNNTIEISTIKKIVDFGKTLYEQPIVIIKDVLDVLMELGKEYRLIIVTKGDLFEQEMKLKSSGLGTYFDYVEVMSWKLEDNYLKLLNRLNIQADEFLMIGNSIKSDILPVLNIGSNACLISDNKDEIQNLPANIITNRCFSHCANIKEIITPLLLK